MFGGEGKVAASGDMVEAAMTVSLSHGSSESEVVLGTNDRYVQTQTKGSVENEIQEPRRVWGNDNDSTSLTAPAYDASLVWPIAAGCLELHLILGLTRSRFSSSLRLTDCVC